MLICVMHDIHNPHQLKMQHMLPPINIPFAHMLITSNKPNLVRVKSLVKYYSGDAANNILLKKCAFPLLSLI